MNSFEIFCLLIWISVYGASGFPQSANEVAVGTKLIEQLYYNNDALGLLPFDNPSGIDNAREEREGYGSKIDSVYDGFQKKTSKIFNTQPLVDEIKESDKFGNNGQQFAGIGKAVTSVMALVSDVVNRVVDAPGFIIQSVVQSANKVLNQVGGKVVGLQK